MTQSETLAGFEIGRTSADRRGGQGQSREIVPQPSSSDCHQGKRFGLRAAHDADGNGVKHASYFGST